MNEPPVNLTLSSTTVDENTPLGTPVGILSSDDPDQPGGVHTYSIVGPAGVPFRIGGTNNRTLLVNGPLDHETSPTSLVIIRATDDGGLFIEKTFKITISGEYCTTPLVSNHLSSATSFPKYQKFPSQITIIFGTSSKQTPLTSDLDYF